MAKIMGQYLVTPSVQRRVEVCLLKVTILRSQKEELLFLTTCRYDPYAVYYW